MHCGEDNDVRGPGAALHDASSAVACKGEAQQLVNSSLPVFSCCSRFARVPHYVFFQAMFPPLHIFGLPLLCLLRRSCAWTGFAI